jgi:hypothetical protein
MAEIHGPRNGTWGRVGNGIWLLLLVLVPIGRL